MCFLGILATHKGNSIQEVTTQLVMVVTILREGAAHIEAAITEIIEPIIIMEDIGLTNTPGYVDTYNSTGRLVRL